MGGDVNLLRMPHLESDCTTACQLSCAGCQPGTITFPYGVGIRAARCALIQRK